MNQTHIPLVTPLNRALHIELYNEKWFNNPINTSIPQITYNHGTLKFPNELFSLLPFVSQMYKGTDIPPPKQLIEAEDPSRLSSPSLSVVYNSLANSDCLFFI